MEAGAPVTSHSIHSDYPIVIGDEKFGALYKVTALPVTLLIDRNGKIADAHMGMVDKDAWETEIRQLLQEKGKDRYDAPASRSFHRACPSTRRHPFRRCR